MRQEKTSLIGIIMSIMILILLTNFNNAQVVYCSGKNKNCYCPTTTQPGETCIFDCGPSEGAHCQSSTLFCRSNDPCEINCHLEPSTKTGHYSSEWEVLNIIKKDLQLHVYSSIMRTCTTDDQDEFMSQVKHCAIDKTDLDIFQVLSFESTLYDPLDIKEVWKYRTRAYKAIICSFTQIVAIAVILTQLVWDAKYGDKFACRNFRHHGAWYMNVLAFLVSMHFSFSILQKLQLTKGFYRYTILIDYNLPWIDHGWLYYGLIVNTVVSVLCVWGGFFIVFYSETALGMIFSVVSVWYLSGLDDAMVEAKDYVSLKNAIENDFKGRDKKKARFTSRTCGKGICCKLTEKMMYIIIGVPWILINYTTIIAAFLMPFYFAACY